MRTSYSVFFSGSTPSPNLKEPAWVWRSFSESFTVMRDASGRKASRGRERPSTFRSPKLSLKTTPKNCAVRRNQFTVNRTRFEPPLSPGLVTVTGIEPADVIRYPGTVTVICVDDTALGKRTALPKLTTAPPWKVPPVIVKVNVPDPAVTAPGDNKLITGATG